MDQKQQEQFEKFREFAGWMHRDCKDALEKAGAQFLVAMALFNYIETLGAFLIGYFRKDDNGQIQICSKCLDGKIRTTTKERFNAFFSYLGDKYKDLADNHPELYNELRCGLTHEFLPKKRRFSILKIPKGTNVKEKQIYCVKDIKSSTVIVPCSNGIVEEPKIQNIDGSTVNCGVMFLHWQNKERWQIFTPKLVIDFKRGVEKLINEIQKGGNEKLNKNFFEAATQINLENFRN